MTGWAVIPQPAWVGAAHNLLRGLLQFATPPGWWMAYGSAYTVALRLMLVGLLGLSGGMRDVRGRLHTKGYRLVLAGLVMAIPGDAVHTWTWHENGLTTPTPGTNPVANTAYAVHMMGMNFVLVGSMRVGISALRRKFLAPWLAWSLRSDRPLGRHRDRYVPADDTERRAVAVQRDDDRPRVLHRPGKVRSACCSIAGAG